MNRKHIRFGSGGRLRIPAWVRRELALEDGDGVILETVDGELRIRPYRDALARAQAVLREYIPEGVSLADDLIANLHRPRSALSMPVSALMGWTFYFESRNAILHGSIRQRSRRGVE